MYIKHIEFKEKIPTEVLVFVEPKRSHFKSAIFGDSNKDSREISPF